MSLQLDLAMLAALDCSARRAFADARWPLIGYGSSRRVYRLGGDRVLKLAYDTINEDEGDACDTSQNRVEARVARDPRAAPGVARVFARGPKHIYLVSEEATPLDAGSFERATGIDTYELEPLLEFIAYHKVSLDAAFGMMLDDRLVEPATVARVLATQAVVTAAYLVERYRVAASDLGTPTHYGATRDGRIVLIDYGFIEP